jgi:hypothetical protein
MGVSCTSAIGSGLAKEGNQVVSHQGSVRDVTGGTGASGTERLSEQVGPEQGNRSLTGWPGAGITLEADREASACGRKPACSPWASRWATEVT